MNIYRGLNDIIHYIETHLEEKIDYTILARFLGVNVYTMQRLFSLMTGLSVTDYIRKRRLSNAGYDLYEKNERIIDIALKYQYENATSFSRAFFKFHGIKPSLVNKETKLKNFPRIVFPEEMHFVTELDYEIVSLDAMKMYGVFTKTSNSTIMRDAPIFFSKTEAKYFKECGTILYGMITYDTLRAESQRYYCLYDKKLSSFEEIDIPQSKWLRFRIFSQDPLEIQEMSQRFYKEFLPSCKYNLKELPELEYYHDDVTDFLVAIY